MPTHRSTQGASHRPCDRCDTPTLRQEVGHRAALKVTTDAEPIPLTEALALVEPNRLAWCLTRMRSGDVELRWQCRGRGPCSHEVVIEHRCPPDTPTVKGALW